jgi:hypothetical protein
MTTKLEYAALSAFVYNDQRSGGAITDLSKLDLPTGWVELKASTGFTAGDNLNTNPYSFTGGAYVNAATGEIVVAYKGTDFLTDFEGRAWNTVADLVTDVSLAITKKTLGLYNLQQLSASSYFLAVKDWAVEHGYDGSKISFTGHSLGGGLASNMAVWFNRPATTFAEGPFELSTINPIAILAAAATLTAQAGVTASAAVLAEISALRDMVFTSQYESRQQAVTNYYNKGEFLQYLRAVWPTVVGPDEPIDIGDQSLSKAVSLHSMNLHAAFLFDDRTCWRTRRASVPARLRARGRGASRAQPASRQHRGLHTDSAASANWLRRSGTATRHVCGLDWPGGEQYQSQDAHSTRPTGIKRLTKRMDWPHCKAVSVPLSKEHA